MRRGAAAETTRLTTRIQHDAWTYLLASFGITMLLNAGWMLATPAHWWAVLPGAVPDFGPLNEHFIRDIGATYLTLGVALVWAAFAPAVRVPVLVIVTTWNAAHAAVHVLDTVRGLVDHEHWALDAPGVYGPTLVLIVITVILLRQERADA